MSAVPAPLHERPATTKDPAGEGARGGPGAGGGPAVEQGGQAETLSPAKWRDPKRYAWLLGLIVPTLPFLAWGLVRATGLGVFWFYGPFLVFGDLPAARPAERDGRDQPARQRHQVAGAGSLLPLVHLPFLPIQYAGLVFACWLWSSGKLSTFDDIGLALTVGMVSGIAINTAHELGHKRASIGALAEQGRARAERLRALLHRAQPRPPRARGHPRGPGERAAGRELLRVPAAHRGRQPELGVGARAHPPGAHAAIRRGRRATTSSARGR